ncbi:NRAMP family divalent metal transporter [Caballeronia sp. Lep1P3]|uniref:NRAMP family divalent metal transporter n=1 Tax=Caballeronia sp. Lep1P3 TaxID=2878150 RepID=UPI001FD23010|nr:divalent metal cation transporter [Caballeronia sp. Lep1P3]
MSERVNKQMADEDSRASARPARSWAADVGPGLASIASDNDPGGIATYTLAGAWYGFDLLWVCVLTYPSTVALQLIAARVAAITGRGLTANMRSHYSSLFYYFAVGRFLIANTCNIAVDVLAIGVALRAFFGGSLMWWALMGGGVSIALQWFVPYARYAQVLKWATLAMFAYVGVIMVVAIPWQTVAMRAFVPHVVWSEEYVTMLIAVLGTTVSPYLMFAQAEQEVQEKNAAGGRDTASHAQPFDRHMRRIRRDTLLRTALSNAGALCMMIAAAATLHLMQATPTGETVQMARVLEPIAHGYAGRLLGVALIGSALLALPPLAGSAAQALASSFDWPRGERRDRRIAWLLLAVMVAGIVGAVVLAMRHVEPVKALYWSAVVNGMTVTPVLALLVLLSSKREVVGDLVAHWTLRALSWLATLATAATIVAHFVLEFVR